MPNAPSILRVKTFINFLIIKAFFMLVSNQIQDSCQSYSRLFSRIFLSVFLLILSWNLSAQIPAQCGSPGCTSNDVRIIRASITDGSGNFPICVGNEAINNLYLHLFVSTNSKRKGVFISATLRITVGSVVNDYPIQHCFSNSLNGDNNDLSVALPPNTFFCGSNVELRTVFTAWGTGLTDFCNGSPALQCPGTPSKCRFVPGEVIIVQTTPCTGAAISPHPQNATACDNGAASFTVGYTPIANNTTTIKWIVNNSGTWDTIQNNAVYNNATTTTLNILNVTGLNNKEYRAVVINTSNDPQVPAANKVCKTVSSSAFLTVDNPSVGGSVAADQTICVTGTPNSLNLSGNTGNVLRWEKASNASFTSPTTIANTTTTLLAADMGALGASNYFRCVVKNGVCVSANSGAAIISVDGSPTTATVGTNQERCGTLESAALGGNTPSTGSGTWTKTSGPGTVSFSPSASNPGATATVSVIGNYEFTWTISNGVCLPSAATILVKYANSSVGGTVAADQTICSNTSPNGLNLSGNTGNVERWERAANVDFTSPTTIANTTTSLSSSDIGALTANTWFRSVVKNSFCPAVNSSFVKITVDGIPSTATVGANQERCGTLVSLGLGGNTPTTGTGAWSKKSGPGTVSFSSASSPNATATVSVAGNYEFTWTISNGVVCTPSTATIAVNYYNIPGNLEATPGHPTCATPTGSITVTTATAGLTFSLNSVLPADFVDNGGVFSSVSPGNYLVRSRNSNGCISNSFAITVNAVPGATPAAAVIILTNPSCSSSTGTLKVVQASNQAEYDNTIYEFSNGGDYGNNPVFGFTAGEGYSINVRKKLDITCLVNVSCTGEPQELGSVEKKMTPDLIKTVGGDNAIIKAYPNPFSDQIKFVVTTKEKGQASLELFNMSGQKIKSVYNGFMAEGIQNFNFTLPQHEMNSVIYVFRQNGKMVTGKLMHVSNKK